MADVECFTAQCSCSAQRHKQVQGALRPAGVECQRNGAKQKCPANFQPARGGVVRADGEVVPGKERRRAKFLGTKRRDPRRQRLDRQKLLTACLQRGWRRGILIIGIDTCRRRGGGRVPTFQCGGRERCKGTQYCQSSPARLPTAVRSPKNCWWQ
jgi:hypothetical protein